MGTRSVNGSAMNEIRDPVFSAIESDCGGWHGEEVSRQFLEKLPAYLQRTQQRLFDAMMATVPASDRGSYVLRSEVACEVWIDQPSFIATAIDCARQGGVITVLSTKK
ncbi:MAG: hypothetical protein C4331_12570 [Meiothermus sp.]